MLRPVLRPFVIFKLAHHNGVLSDSHSKKAHEHRQKGHEYLDANLQSPRQGQLLNSPIMTNGIHDISQNNPSSSPWVYDSSFGIGHHHGCRVCRSYRTHLSDADDSDVGYAHAVQDREVELRNRYLDGFRRGRETQRQHDNELLKAYRSQRDTARGARSLYKLRLEETEAEVLHLRDELLALRIAYDELRPRSPFPNFIWTGGGALSEQNAESSSDESGYNLATSGTDEFSDESGEDSWVPVETSGESDNCEEIEEIDSQSENRGDPVEIFDQLSSEVVVERNDTQQVSLFSIQFATEGEQGPSDVRNLVSSILQPKPPPSNLCTPYDALRSSENDSLEEIRRKMTLACHPDNRDMLAHVKALVYKAHITPAGGRTEAQKVLICEWRRPPLSPSLRNHDGPKSARFLDVCVDASQKGIGFFFEGQWQAWKLKEGWKKKTREIQWAEAAAAELGLRLMIQAGHDGGSLRLRSDNSGVVDAIQKGDFHQPQVGIFVKNIYSLCRLNEITLGVKWISGEGNPADAPSRLRPAKGSSRFPFKIDIPPHLEDFLLPYDP